MNHYCLYIEFPVSRLFILLWIHLTVLMIFPLENKVIKSHVYLIRWTCGIINRSLGLRATRKLHSCSWIYWYDAVMIHCVLSAMLLISIGEEHRWNISANCAASEHWAWRTLHAWPEALGWLAESEIHAIVLLLERVYLGSHLKLLLDGHLGTIDGWSISSIELWWIVHYWVHIQLLTTIYRLTLIFEHNASGQVNILILLHRTSFTKWTAEVSRRMHLFHYTSHCRCCLFILFFLL